jgi:excisionase family DNA binding protein
MTNWISTKKAMHMLGVSATTIKRWSDDGRLPFRRTVGGHRRFRVSAVQHFLNQQGDSTDELQDAREWLHWLQEKDVHLICDKVLQLRETRGDWFAASDFLSQVTVEICRDRYAPLLVKVWFPDWSPRATN